MATINNVKSFDAIIAGAGIIGVSFALELRRRGLNVLVVDRGQPGAEASTAAAGMLAPSEVDGPPELIKLARLSAEMYPDFVRAAETDSGLAPGSVDFNRDGAICLGDASSLGEASNSDQAVFAGRLLSVAELAALEPALARPPADLTARFVAEDVVDPRTLMPALVEAAKRLGVHFLTGSKVTSVVQSASRVTGLSTKQAEYHAPIVVNCCGAWSGELRSGELTPAAAALAPPTRPVKGHMLALIPAHHYAIRHVIRHRESDTYLVPRRSGRIDVGSTVEEAGFDKQVDPDIVRRLHQLAIELIPELATASIHESWTGLRPGTPDKLPILGPTFLSGYFIATGHFRNGILLAPGTALIMADLITGAQPIIDISPFVPARFAPEF